MRVEKYVAGTQAPYIQPSTGNDTDREFPTDTGGNPDYQDKDTMFQYLRVRGTLPEGSVITVEPGVYFCRFIIEPYLKDEKHKAFINEDVLNRYWDVGGVRIEGRKPPFLSAELRIADVSLRR